MKIKNIIVKVIALCLLIVIFGETIIIGTITGKSIMSLSKFDDNSEKDLDKYIKKSSPHSYQVYHFILKYCKIYNVPTIYAFRVAKLETSWESPIQKKYNAAQISRTGALGAMQVLLSTGKDVWKDISSVVVTRNRLLHDIEFNIHTAIRYQRQLYNSYKSWEKVYSIYSDGYTIVNGYSRYVVK